MDTLSSCSLCGAWYTGQTRDELCAACYQKDRARIYTDPDDADAWLKRQYQRMEAKEKFEAAWEGREWIDSKPSGRCPICGKVMDDHRLTYSDNPKCLGLCQKVAARK